MLDYTKARGDWFSPTSIGMNTEKLCGLCSRSGHQIPDINGTPTKIRTGSSMVYVILFSQKCLTIWPSGLLLTVIR